MSTCGSGVCGGHGQARRHGNASSRGHRSGHVPAADRESQVARARCPRAAHRDAVPPRCCAAADPHCQASTLFRQHRRPSLSAGWRWPSRGLPNDPPGAKPVVRGAFGKGGCASGIQPRTVSHDSTTHRACVNKRNEARVQTPPGSAHKVRHSAVDLGEWLADIQKIVEHPHAELERRDRHPLVDAVEHACEVQLRG
jgi:hypothetical protein